MVSRAKRGAEAYGYYQPKVMSSAPLLGSYRDSIPEIANFHDSFCAIQTSGDCLRAKIKNRIPSPDYTYYDIDAILGKRNHFQGVQRTYGKNYVIFSGADRGNKNAHLFVVKMESRPVGKHWRYDLKTKNIPLADDRIVTVIKINDTTNPQTNEASRFNLKHGIDRDMWHAGGISLFGDILATPLEGDEKQHCSKVVFYCLRDPEKPALFDFVIDRPTESGGTLALTRLPNGRFLLAVLYTPKMNKKTHRIDFYISKSKDFADGFNPKLFQWKEKHLTGKLKKFENYQGIELLHDSNKRLFLVGTFNESETAPVFNGSDFADLFEITFKNVDKLNITAPFKDGDTTLMYIIRRRFHCDMDDSNMNGGAGIHVLDDGTPILYCCNHFVKNRMRRDSQIGYLRFDEYGVQAGTGNRKIITDIAEGWIDLFEHSDFRGARITIHGEDWNKPGIKNYKNIYVRNKHFGDKTSSLRFQLPLGAVYQLFEDHNFKGGHVRLRGTGGVNEANSIRFGVSSSRFLR